MINVRFENGGFPDSGVLIDTFEEPPLLGLNVDEEATIRKLKQRIKNGIFKEVTMDNKKNGLFNIGDEVITSDGRKGKIVDICHCEECERRGFYELKVLYDEDDEAEYITNDDKERNFCDFYKIGNTIFGNADMSKIDSGISLFSRMVAVYKGHRKNLLEAMNNGKE